MKPLKKFCYTISTFGNVDKKEEFMRHLKRLVKDDLCSFKKKLRIFLNCANFSMNV